MKSLTNECRACKVRIGKKKHEYQNTLTDEMQFSCSH